ncbi:hypothetical protein CEXT_695181 [Caerostris extrusa]|uniref:Uncharacterized protein n=1 Tax=Caerostris extrusa TaxID=172846 RepID=A0AAV4TJ12_CAEEX|nr:hypothetical protein CEXT_695181 [Caerostris extrusa]
MKFNAYLFLASLPSPVSNSEHLMPHHRKLFTYLIVCAFLFGGIYVIRFRLKTASQLLPDFLPNAARYRHSRVCAPSPPSSSTLHPGTSTGDR